MPDYQLGKIYKIVSEQDDKFYIGSTTQPSLASRMTKHRHCYKKWKETNTNYFSSFEIMKYEDCMITLIEVYPCVCRDELRAREQFHINQNKENVVNKQKADTGIRAETPEEADKLRGKQYYQENKDKYKLYSKNYKEKNKEKINHYKEANLDRIRETERAYREKNAEIIK